MWLDDSQFRAQEGGRLLADLFVAGTKLLAPRSSGISSSRDLRDKTIVVTAGTTNEAVRAISDKQHLGIKFMVGNDQAESFAMLKEGKAAAFATDDILLYGLVAIARLGDQYHVVGEYLSYDPYGLMYRKDDPDFTAIVDHTFGVSPRAANWCSSTTNDFSSACRPAKPSTCP